MFAKLTFGLDRTLFGADLLDFAFFFYEPTHVTQIGQCHFAAVLGRVYLTTHLHVVVPRTCKRHHQQVAVVRRSGVVSQHTASGMALVSKIVLVSHRSQDTDLLFLLVVCDIER